MRLHGNAALSWQGRRRLARRVVVEGWTLSAAAEAAGVSVRCAQRWSSRYRIEGEPGLLDRSSAPKRVANRTPDDRVAAIATLRGLRMTAAEIAETLGMALSTVSVVLKRQGMGRLGLIGLEQPIRYERSRPGELVHIDVKKLGRIQGGAGWRVRDRKQHYNRTVIDRDGHRRNTVGWEFVHIAIDDYSRFAYVEVLPDEKAATAATASRSSGSLPTTAAATEPPSTPSPAAHSASNTAAPAPTVPRPTAKPNASSARCSPAGPTARSTAQATNAQPPLTAGSGTTTIDDDTQPSATNPRPAEPTCLGPTSRSRPAASRPSCPSSARSSRPAP